MLDWRASGIRRDAAVSAGLRRCHRWRARQQSRPAERRLSLAVPVEPFSRWHRDHPCGEAPCHHQGGCGGVRQGRRCARRRHRRSALGPIRSGLVDLSRQRGVRLPHRAASVRTQPHVRRREESRTGEQIYPGWSKSSEALTTLTDGRPASGWNQYWGTRDPMRVNFWRLWVFNDPQWNPRTLDFDRDLTRADDTIGKLVDQRSVDLAAFKKRSGVAIVYQGWQDPVVNPLDTIAYYEGLRTQQGSQQEADRFFRLFLVPGMGHCSGGTGTTSFGNQGGALPTVDADHDLLSALDRWVEQRTPPDRIIASKVESGKVVRTRPLCVYPKRAVYQGSGSTDDAENFSCR